MGTACNVAKKAIILLSLCTYIILLLRELDSPNQHHFSMEILYMLQWLINIENDKKMPCVDTMFH